MDDIQRTLIQAGRKDLAQEYYQKTAVNEFDKRKFLKLEDDFDASFLKLRKFLTDSTGYTSGHYNITEISDLKFLKKKMDDKLIEIRLVLKKKGLL